MKMTKKKIRPAVEGKKNNGVVRGGGLRAIPLGQLRVLECGVPRRRGGTAISVDQMCPLPSSERKETLNAEPWDAARDERRRVLRRSPCHCPNKKKGAGKFNLKGMGRRPWSSGVIFPNLNKGACLKRLVVTKGERGGSFSGKSRQKEEPFENNLGKKGRQSTDEGGKKRTGFVAVDPSANNPDFPERAREEKKGWTLRWKICRRAEEKPFVR